MKIGNRVFDTNKHTYICGILNVTPDSFSDGGNIKNISDALYRVEQMISEGADIIDIGGESTRPGADSVSAEEEASRVIPVIEAVVERFDVPISLDTYKSSVASLGIKAGAHMINDIWGLKYDNTMAQAIAASSDTACVCIMHNRHPISVKGDATDYGYVDIVADVSNDLMQSIQLATNAGIGDERIIIDPGVGFAKDVNQNLQIIESIDRLKCLGYPILLGCSRKSFIGKTLNLDIDDRLYPTVATSVIAACKGAAFVRVHDIAPNVLAVKMAEAIINS